jgi:hypothetical protein
MDNLLTINTPLEPTFLKVFRALDYVPFNVRGNNTAFGTTGAAVVGSIKFSKTPSEILTNEAVFKYNANGLNGQNDFFGYSVIPTPFFKGTTRSLQIKYKTVNAVDSDVSLNVKIIGGVRNGAIVKQYLKASTSSIISMAFDVPNDCTSLVVGLQNHATTTNLQIFVDDISLGYKAFDSLNTVTQESISHTGYTSKDGSNRVTCQ